jgi:hypothetical protein
MIDKPLDIAQILGPIPGDLTFSTWRVLLRDGTITNLSVTANSSANIDITIVEYHDVFKRLADE